MHDRNHTPLKLGDVVLLPAIVTELHPTDEYCNVQLLSVHGRRPDEQHETVYAINTAVVVLYERPQESKA